MKRPVQPRGSDQFALRMPPGLRDRIAAYAKTNGRSINTEIIATLMEHYPDLDEETEKRIANLRDAIFSRVDAKRGAEIFEAVTDLIDFIATAAETHDVEIVHPPERATLVQVKTRKPD